MLATKLFDWKTTVVVQSEAWAVFWWGREGGRAWEEGTEMIMSLSTWHGTSPFLMDFLIISSRKETATNIFWEEKWPPADESLRVWGLWGLPCLLFPKAASVMWHHQVPALVRDHKADLSFCVGHSESAYKERGHFLLPPKVTQTWTSLVRKYFFELKVIEMFQAWTIYFWNPVSLLRRIRVKEVQWNSGEAPHLPFYCLSPNTAPLLPLLWGW